MSCYHPLTGFRSLTPNENGKYPVKIFKSEYRNELVNEFGNNVLPIPCGKCIGCRLDYSRQWADRCMAEASYYVNNCFLTLTYNDENLPPKLDNSPIHSLVKSDLQKFMKDLRSALVYEYDKEYFNDHTKKEDDYNPPRVRFFSCGEYGERNNRPHYHLLLFGYCPEDIVLYKKSAAGFSYYTSEFISKIWKKGYCVITELTWDTCAYTARYVIKKQKGENSKIYKELNYVPEFTLMSRKPGIGKQFYEDHDDIVINPVYVATKNGKKLIRSNRYYDKLFDIDYPDRLEYIKADRTDQALRSIFLKLDQCSMNAIELRHSEELNKLAQVKALKRKEV